MKLYVLYAIYIPVFFCWLTAELIYWPFEALGLFVKNKIEIELAKQQGGAS